MPRLKSIMKEEEEGEEGKYAFAIQK